MEKKTLKLKDIKSKFKIPYSKAEEYARILDEQGMLSFYFPVIGYPILKIKDLKKDVARHKLSKVMRLLIFVLIISALMVATYFILREYGYV